MEAWRGALSFQEREGRSGQPLQTRKGHQDDNGDILSTHCARTFFQVLQSEQEFASHAEDHHGLSYQESSSAGMRKTSSDNRGKFGGTQGGVESSFAGARLSNLLRRLQGTSGRIAAPVALGQDFGHGYFTAGPTYTGQQLQSKGPSESSQSFVPRLLRSSSGEYPTFVHDASHDSSGVSFSSLRRSVDNSALAKGGGHNHGEGDGWRKECRLEEKYGVKNESNEPREMLALKGGEVEVLLREVMEGRVRVGRLEMAMEESRRCLQEILFKMHGGWDARRGECPDHSHDRRFCCTGRCPRSTGYERNVHRDRHCTCYPRHWESRGERGRESNQCDVGARVSSSVGQDSDDIYFSDVPEEDGANESDISLSLPPEKPGIRSLLVEPSGRRQQNKQRIGKEAEMPPAIEQQEDDESLLKVVEDQHMTIGQLKKKVTSAERELGVLRDEVGILRKALAESDEMSEGIEQWVEQVQAELFSKLGGLSGCGEEKRSDNGFRVNPMAALLTSAFVGLNGLGTENAVSVWKNVENEDVTKTGGEVGQNLTAKIEENEVDQMEELRQLHALLSNLIASKGKKDPASRSESMELRRAFGAGEEKPSDPWEGPQNCGEVRGLGRACSFSCRNSEMSPSWWQTTVSSLSSVAGVMVLTAVIASVARNKMVF